MKDIIIEHVKDLEKSLIDISDYICANPELGNKEFKAVQKLTDFLASEGFEVETNIVNRETAFRAVYDSEKAGPCIAYLCEYDALPEIGHGCGHNMIGAMSAVAAAALSRCLASIGGKIIVLGTPAEESDGAKVDMSAQGIFDEVDAAMILHPEDKNYESGVSLAMEAIQFEFTGKASHAASAPHEGINALDAVLLTFNGINALRQHIKSDSRIHGIICDGGKAANIVPDKAKAQFYVRAGKKKYLAELLGKVKNIARGAALMTGASVEITNYEISYDDMNTNKILSKAFSDNLKFIGIEDIHPPRSSYGSIDMGNVSNVVPSIHPYISISDTPIIAHTEGFRNAAVSSKAHKALVQGASALALTGYDIITDKKLLNSIKEEFSNLI